MNNTDRKKYIVYSSASAVVLLCAVALIFSFPGFLHPVSRPGGLQQVRLAGQVLQVSVADTEAAREQGLSGRTGLAADEGMLFVFPADGIYPFWMKDMRFAIDILWISGAKVIYIAQNVSPDTYPQTFTSGAPARLVLELPAGYVARHHIQVGDTVEL